MVLTDDDYSTIVRAIPPRAGRSTTISSASRTSCSPGNAGEVLVFTLAVIPLGLGVPPDGLCRSCS